MTSSRFPRRRRGGFASGTAVLLMAAVILPSLLVPASTTARAAPTVSATPVAAVVAGAAGRVELARWTWPVGPVHDLGRSFQAPAGPYGAGHRGIDVAAQPGTAVRAPADGVVSFAGVVVDRPVLSIQHSDGLLSSIEPVTAQVAQGDRVSAGQVVGVVATGAHCSDRCVHFGVRRHGQYISPLLLLGGLAPAVLLPLHLNGTQSGVLP
jgi:murein DD-endopeptidase MepM/ murein hydrolase activator NlpD